MSTLLLALLACSDDGALRRYYVTASYGDYEIVGMDGMVAGAFHGYLADGQFGLPTIAVELGDTVEITLQNDTLEPMGLHPHGVRYDTANDGASRVADPGGTVTYTWEATEGTGTFLYHSHEMDSNGYEYQAEAGILGALVVLDPKAPAPDRMLTYLMTSLYEPWTESVTSTTTPAEEQSPQGSSSATARPVAPDETIGTDCPLDPVVITAGDDDEEPLPEGDPVPVDGTHTTDTSTSTGHSHGAGGSTLGTHNHALVVQSVSGAGWLDTDTRESNRAQIGLGEDVQVNVVGFGSEFHTFHLHGYTWKDPGTGQTVDTVTLGPGTSYGFTLPAVDNPGEWLVHCHVETHNHSMTGWLDVE